ncbi:MAG: hypothetical protein WA005_09100 [Candidatus Binataceae bacterium]
MKTAVSLPDPVFHAAERLARRLRVPRSRLYAKAIAAFVEQHRAQDVTAKLNEVYGAQVDESRLDPMLAAIQSRSLPREDW